MLIRHYRPSPLIQPYHATLTRPIPPVQHTLVPLLQLLPRAPLLFTVNPPQPHQQTLLVQNTKQTQPAAFPDGVLRLDQRINTNPVLQYRQDTLLSEDYLQLYIVGYEVPQHRNYLPDAFVVLWREYYFLLGQKETTELQQKLSRLGCYCDLLPYFSQQ